MKNYWNFIKANKKYVIITFVIAYILGGLFKGTPPSDDRFQAGLEAGRQAITADARKEFDQREAKWKELKETDDEFIQHSKAMTEYFTMAFDAASRFDVKEMERIATDIRILSVDVKYTLEERNAILKDLGY